MVKNAVGLLLERQTDFFDKISLLSTYERSLGCVDGRIIGTGRSDYTIEATDYTLNIQDKKFALIDIPGIEGDESKFEKIIRESLEKAHLIFYINGSGKKPEKATLEKIKKYMHDGTSVYSLFNVHCKAKKERIDGIDKAFSEELMQAYNKQNEVVSQTEGVLKSFLGDNYKGSLTLNGLLAFSSVSYDKDGFSTIVYDENKNLRNDQKKYLIEYKQNKGLMKKESKIDMLQNIIEANIDGYQDTIYLENIKKLKNRLSEMIDRLSNLESAERIKIEGFCKIYDEFISNCSSAKDSYIQQIHNLGYDSAMEAFEEIKIELFEKIEMDRGRTKESEIQKIFESQKDEIICNVSQNVNDKLKRALEEYEEGIDEATNRLITDFSKEELKFKVNMESGKIKLDMSFLNELNYSIKDLGKHLLTIGSMALSGAGIGSAIPVIGTIVGAGIGVFIGILSSIWNFFASESKRINRAKNRLASAIDEMVADISKELDNEIKRMNYEEVINNNYEQISNAIDKQKTSLSQINKLIENVVWSLKKEYRVV